MYIKNRINALAAVVFCMVLSLSACVKEMVNSNLRRDTDVINIAYNQDATATVNIRYNGQWYASSEVDWLKVTPDQANPAVGDGKEFQQLTITASRNNGKSRKGIVHVLSADGTQDAKVEVTQAEGVFIVKEPEFSGTLTKGQGASASVVVKYSKAAGGEKLKIQASIEGDPGLSIKPETEFEVPQEGDNSVSVSITGNATIFGEITIPVKVFANGTLVQEKTLKANVLAPEIVLMMNFDKMIFGGDYPNNAPGIGVNGAQTYRWYADPSEYTEMNGLDKDGVYDAFGDSNADWSAHRIVDYRKDRGLDGCEGRKCYEHPGYLKMGTGSDYGSLTLPALSSLQGPSTVTLSIDLLRFDNTTGTIKILTNGDEKVIGGEFNADNFPAQTKAADRKWQTKTVRIENATSGTRITITAKDSPDLSKTRFNIDNILVTTTVNKLKEQLPAVDIESVDFSASTTTSIVATWPEVQDADAYSVTISPLLTPEFRNTVEATSNSYSFKNLPAGIYFFEIQAISYGQPEFNSEVVSKLAATEGVTIPQLEIETVLLNATQYGIRWTANQWSDFTRDVDLAYRLATYKDEACTKLHSAHVFPKNFTHFSSTRVVPFQQYPQFMVSGLDPDKDYWIELTATEYGIKTVMKIHTAKNPVVTLPASQAKAGEVILYEDFGEWPFGGECVLGLPGWSLKATGTATEAKYYKALGEDPIGTSGGVIAYYGPEKHSGMMNTFKWHVPNTRQKDWGAINEDGKEGALCMAAGLVKIGASSKCAQIVTPTINCLAGEAEIEVSFDAAPYMDPTSGTSYPYKYDPATCIVQVYNNSARQDESKYINHEIGTPSETQVHKFRLPAESDSDYKWVRYTKVVTVKNGESIGIGSYRDPDDSGNSNKQRRMYIDNIQLKVLSYK